MNAMTELKNLRMPLPIESGIAKYDQLDVEFEPETRSIWTYMKPSSKACFNLGILADFHHHDETFEKNHGKVLFNNMLIPVDYFVIASRHKHVFSYGGDLDLFVRLIKSRDREALLHYAKLCVDGIYARTVNHASNALTISLIQGDALGGGFELGLTSNIIIAEESARMGLPEILFNLFPGMGAYSLLVRRLGMKRAEEMILSGKIFEARELYKMGIVDVVAPNGAGEATVFDFMRQNTKRLNGMRAMYACRHHSNPIPYEELMNITEIWVDAALNLEERDLKMMGRLVRAQTRQQGWQENKDAIAIKTNWTHKDYLLQTAAKTLKEISFAL